MEAMETSLNWPNRFVITSGTGRQAFDAIVEVSGFDRKWSGLAEAEDCIRRTILEHFIEFCNAPDVLQWVGSTGMTFDEVGAHLISLRNRDLIVLDDSDKTIFGAYPFTENRTGHQILFRDHILNAMCAIDALGAGAMCHSDVTIVSSCLHCGSEVRISTKDSGEALGTVTPQTSGVFSGIEYADQCAATSPCPVLAFFCSDEHLRTWKKENPGSNGYRLSMEEALQIRRAIFMDHLEPVSASSQRK